MAAVCSLQMAFVVYCNFSFIACLLEIFSCKYRLHPVYKKAIHVIVRSNSSKKIRMLTKLIKYWVA